jgi:hypothetical protein
VCCPCFLYLALCCLQASPEYTFANKAGLEILGTSIHELASVDWNKSMDDEGRKLVYAASSQVLQQVTTRTAPHPRRDSLKHAFLGLRCRAEKV